MQDADTLKPEPIDEGEFRCGYNMARIATLSVLEGLSSRSHSLRMGFLAYQSIKTGIFTSADEIVAAEFAELLNLTSPTKFG